MKNKVIALDFDGVIADTEKECYVISIPAFRRMGEEIEEDERLREEFRKARPLVRIADDYYVVLKMLQESGTDFDSVSLQAFIKEREKYREKGKEFHKLFYEERTKLQKNMQEWIGLNPPFEGMPEIIKNLSRSFPLFIVTSKDKRATQILLESYGIHLEEENILPKEISLDKKDHMKFIAKRSSIPFSSIVFVEDLLEQLLSVKELGVKLILVSWGYNTEQQREEARKNGVPVAAKDNFEEIVRSI